MLQALSKKHARRCEEALFADDREASRSEAEWKQSPPLANGIIETTSNHSIRKITVPDEGRWNHDWNDFRMDYDEKH